MKIHDLKLASLAANGSLREEHEENLVELAESLAICMAEMRKWDAFRQVAAMALGEGMRLLDVEEMQTEDHSFVLDENGIEVKYQPAVGEVVH